MLTTEISPVPTDAEAAAIVAAVEALWPKATLPVPGVRHGSTVWRFSGRWWQRDRFASAERPWI